MNKKSYLKACESDIKQYDALMKDGAFETVKNGIKELHSALWDLAKGCRSQRLKKAFFIGTTAGLGVLLAKERKKNKELESELNEKEETE